MAERVASRLKTISRSNSSVDPNISPDGKLVAYVVSKIDQGAEPAQLFNLDGGHGWQPRAVAIHHVAAILEFAALESRRQVDRVSFIAARGKCAAQLARLLKPRVIRFTCYQ